MANLTTNTETTVLLTYLNAQRDHVLGILEGLDDEALHRPMLPSGWSCLGMLQHLALDVERFWFRCVVAGEQTAIESMAAIPNAWNVEPNASVEKLIALYRQEIALANEITASRSAESDLAWWPGEMFGDWRMENVRQVLLHVMSETATHAGHLDAARELIDGRKWFVLTE